jgi:hypothetical protein
MEIIVSAEEVIVPSGQYGDPDDLLCRGCGREVVWGNNHHLLCCLQKIREDYEKAVAGLQSQIDSLKRSDRLL